MINARYVHTNLIAQDWKKLAQFYEQVFGCTPVPPERKLAGQCLEDGTGVPEAEICGMHLRLPGYGNEGPTLEIFEYSHPKERAETAADRPGYGHIAFVVDDIEAMQDAVIGAGGGAIGKVVSLEVAGAGRVTFVYLTDPEGNIIELQRW